jgi:hypothetical protein
VTNAHRVWREALKAGAPSEAALEGLIQALAENETALRSFGESLAR